MTTLHALSVIALVAGQAGAAPAPPSEAPAAQPPSGAAAPAVQLAAPKLTPLPRLVPGGAPALRPDRTTRCFERGDGLRWRAQCDALTKTCLVAPDGELSSDGGRRGDLERASPCAAPGWREDDLVKQGYQVLPALAETPPGWRRDDQQRIMQVSFDLNRRVWLGAGYIAGDLPWSKQGVASAGIRWDAHLRWAGAPAVARFHVLETDFSFGGDLVELTALSVDVSRVYPSPLLRVSTFIGRPRRFDLNLDVGGWVEGLRVETIRTESRRWFDRATWGSAGLTLDVWRPRGLDSYLRLRGGIGYEGSGQLDGGAWVPLAAADLETNVDRAGFHNVRATFLAEWVNPSGASRYQPEDARAPLLPEHRRRLTGKLQYEWIFLAVNDQPLSLVLEGRAQQRDDVPDLPTKWMYQGTASMRFNLFAPARRNAPAQEAL